MEIKDKYIKEFKTSIRITTTVFDECEIIPMVDAALLDMKGVGINVDIENPLHRQAIKHYLKAYFGENPNKADWIEAYTSLRDALSLRSSGA